MATLSKPSCLIAEDQALIALALEAALEDAGIEIAGPFGSCVAASAWVERHTPELAILDFKLADGPCTDLAKTLLGRGVPVIITSGCPNGPETPSELRGVIWLEKPIDPQALWRWSSDARPLSPVTHLDAGSIRWRVFA